MEAKIKEAKDALDAIIRKSRVHLYKPIQIGEILYHDRVLHDVDLENLESYRNSSKRWRDEITRPLLGRICNSSARFQDDLFNENALPPHLIKELAYENRRTQGAVEAYIYRRFTTKYIQLSEALALCVNSTKDSFNVQAFLSAFWSEAGLKRSLDKVFEIVVYSLFSTLVDTLRLQVEVSVAIDQLGVLYEFEDFAQMVMGLSGEIHKSQQSARVYRVGVTNAADRGLDMYSNWGPAIQIKHLTLDAEIAESIVHSISSDRIVIVCKSVERDIIVSLLTQIGWRGRIQSIITEKELVDWYEKALRGIYSNQMGDVLLKTIRDELKKEFPSVSGLPEVLEKRQYVLITHPDWL